MRYAAGMLLSAMMAGCGADGSNSSQTSYLPAYTEEPLPVVFIGDSITDSWNLPAGIINAGISGQVSGQMLDRFDRDVLRFHPSVVTILAGTNDIRFISTANTDNIAAMAASASSHGACVILGTIPPIIGWEKWTPYTDVEGRARVAAFNAAVISLAQVYGYRLARYDLALSVNDEQNRALFTDEVHPNEAGHEAMWGVVSPLMSDCGVALTVVHD